MTLSRVRGVHSRTRDAPRSKARANPRTSRRRRRRATLLVGGRQRRAASRWRAATRSSTRSTAGRLATARFATATRSLVTPPKAETTTASGPSRAASATSETTPWTRSGVATEVPPNLRIFTSPSPSAPAGRRAGRGMQERHPAAAAPGRGARRGAQRRAPSARRARRRCRPRARRHGGARSASRGSARSANGLGRLQQLEARLAHGQEGGAHLSLGTSWTSSAAKPSAS